MQVPSLVRKLRPFYAIAWCIINIICVIKMYIYIQHKNNRKRLQWLVRSFWYLNFLTSPEILKMKLDTATLVTYFTLFFPCYCRFFTAPLLTLHCAPGCRGAHIRNPWASKTIAKFMSTIICPLFNWSYKIFTDKQYIDNRRHKYYDAPINNR